MGNKRTKVKPYPLKWKLLTTLKTFRSASLNGLEKAVQGNYSIHTIRKTLRQLETDKFIRSSRDENKNKIYALAGHGADYIEKINLKTFGFDEHEIDNILLGWGTFVDYKKIELKEFPKGLDELSGLAMNKENEMLGLVIEKNNEKPSELKERIRRIVEIGKKFTKIYYVSFSSNIEDEIPTEIEVEYKEKTKNGTEQTVKHCTKIELF